MADRKKDTGEALTEIRTVRSRAESALARIATNDGKAERQTAHAYFGEDGEYVLPETVFFRDPDADEMVAALETFVAATAKWANKTRKPGVINQKMGF